MTDRDRTLAEARKHGTPVSGWCKVPLATYIALIALAERAMPDEPTEEMCQAVLNWNRSYPEHSRPLRVGYELGQAGLIWKTMCGALRDHLAKQKEDDMCASPRDLDACDILERLRIAILAGKP